MPSAGVGWATSEPLHQQQQQQQHQHLLLVGGLLQRLQLLYNFQSPMARSSAHQQQHTAAHLFLSATTTCPPSHPPVTAALLVRLAVLHPLHRKNAWGYDEANVASHSPSAWFDLGLTIVDSIDTLLVAGLLPEYQEARHWVANHLHFPDGSTVQVCAGVFRKREGDAAAGTPWGPWAQPVSGTQLPCAAMCRPQHSSMSVAHLWR
jgi:hypothetical protein